MISIILQNEFIAKKYIETYGKNYYLPVVSESYGNIESLSKSVAVVEWNTGESLEKAILYLEEKGHQKIAYASPHSFEDSKSRTATWRYRMKLALKNRLTDYYLHGRTTDTMTLSDYVDSPWRNEEFAGDFVRELQRAAIKIPEDISVVSLDGSYRRSTVVPKLVSIGPDLMQYGESP